MSLKDQESLQIDLTAVHQQFQKWQLKLKLQGVDDIKQL